MIDIYPRRLYPVILKDKEGGDSCVISEKHLTEKGVVYLNTTAREVFLNCDGSISAREMAERFAVKYDGSSLDEILSGVISTLEHFSELGLTENMREKGLSCGVKVKNSRLNLDLVYFEVTRICNLRCIHCYNEAGQKRESEMGTDKILEIIKKLGDVGVIDVVVTGGEPFVRKDIFEILKAIKAREMRFSVFTNGLLLNEKTIKEIAALEPRFVAVSLDGASATTHERIRGMGTFEKTLAALRLLKVAGINVRVNHTLTMGSIREMEDFMCLMDQLEIKDVYFDRFDSLGRGKEHEDMVIPVDMGHEIKSRIDRLRHHENSSVKEYSTGINVLSVSGGNMCGVGINSCYIKANGEISFCPVMSAAEFTVGSLLEKSIDELWNSSKWDLLREATVDSIEECTNCEGKNICLGGCKAKAYNTYGTFKKPDSWTCAQLRG